MPRRVPARRLVARAVAMAIAPGERSEKVAALTRCAGDDPEALERALRLIEGSSVERPVGITDDAMRLLRLAISAAPGDLVPR